MVRSLRVLIFLGGGAVSILVAPGLFRKLRQSVNYLNVKSVSQEMRDFLVVFLLLIGPNCLKNIVYF